MTKKSKLIIAGSTVLAGSVITGIAVPLSLKANEPILEQKQEEEQQDDDSKKTEEKNGQTEINEQQVDSQKDGDTQKQQDDAESTTGGKTEEDNKATETNEQQVDSQKDGTEEKQQDDAESTTGEKSDGNSGQIETNEQEIDSQKDGAEVASGGKTEKDNKETQPMKSQVVSQSSDAKQQQDGANLDKKAEETKTIETGEQKGKELQLKLTPVSLSFNNQGQKYFYLKLQTSNETFEKIKQDRLKFTLDRGDREYDELASEFGYGNQNIYYLNFKNESNGNVSFEISSNLSYGAKDEKGKYKVTKVWLSKDSSQANLLDRESNTVDVP